MTDHSEKAVRPEDAVACPACAKAPGDACDGPTSHPLRKLALETLEHSARLRDVVPGGRFEQDIAAARAAIGTPSQRPQVTGPVVIHGDGSSRGVPGLHRPTLARTLNEGPGNATRIRGCSCGAYPMSPEAFADHVGVPVTAVRALLNLASLAYDLIAHPDHAKMQREVVEPRIARCLEFQL